MAGISRFSFLAIAVVFHLVYIYSIFDIYFVSPIVSGMRLYGVERAAGSRAPADRLVLFVGDGLRADKAFLAHPEPYPATASDLTPRPLAPYLRSRVLEHGTFGVSHTRVPTESRPGHVALIAGLYEDVSAVTTGWKLNPVNFDSVFNRSRHTWSWGSPDILPMFQTGAVDGRVDSYTYGAELEDYSQDATNLDHWVFDHVRDFFEVEARANATLAAELRRDKVVLFLHLLGLDTTGHSYRPYSKEYLNNIKVVDEGVRRTVDVIDKFYGGDGRTAFVFTADHGMSDWGSHGDGHPDNTRTPLIAWGSGVAKPQVFGEPRAVESGDAGADSTTTTVDGTGGSSDQTSTAAGGGGDSDPRPSAAAPGHDDFSAPWNLSHVARHDVAQADVAALMAFLVGVEFPANSVGELPLAYLSAPLSEKAEAALANARGILDMYRVKEEGKKRSAGAGWRYRPYGPLSGPAGTTANGAAATDEAVDDDEGAHASRIRAESRPEETSASARATEATAASGHDAPQARVAHIRRLIDEGKHEEAIEESAALVRLGLEGLRYLQTYDWLFLRALVTLGYLGWMAFALAVVVDLHVLQQQQEGGEGGAKTEAEGAKNEGTQDGNAAAPPSTPGPRRFSPSRTPQSLGFFGAALLALYASFVSSKSPPTYFAYAFFTVAFWEEVWARGRGLVEGGKVLFGDVVSKGGTGWMGLAVNAVVYVGIIVSLALGYIHREVLTGLFVLGAFWPATYGLSFLRQHVALAATWFASCLVMSTFTLLPANKVEDVPLTIVGGALMVTVGLFYLAFEDYVLADFSAVGKRRAASGPTHTISRTLIGIQIGLVLLAMVVTRSSALSLQAKLGLPRGNQVVGWIVLITSLLMPLSYRLQPNSHYLHRLIVMFLTCAPTFVILTISYEGLFYVAFSATLVTWARLEHQLYVFHGKKSEGGAGQRTNGSASSPPARPPQSTTARRFRPLELGDARVALFFLVLLQSAFFSTGNVASISSFSLESVTRLIPIFDPFSQGALLILKIMIPFALVSANLGILNVRLGVSPSALFMLVMAVSDVLTLYFFWVVKDEGSWLEIGSTISHFAIASLLCVFVAGLEGVSALFIAGIEVDQHRAEDRAPGNAKDAGKVVGAHGNGHVLEASQQAPDKKNDTGVPPERENGPAVEERVVIH